VDIAQVATARFVQPARKADAGGAVFQASQPMTELVGFYDGVHALNCSQPATKGKVAGCAQSNRKDFIKLGQAKRNVCRYLF